MSENQLQVIVAESGLDSTKAQVILNQFQDYFAIAADWETKARAIVVSNDSQEAEMKMARAGRLFLKEKRVAIEKTRKELKEQALREGKAIDGIANVLKALIVPIEEYLERQEKFVEIKQQAEAERFRIEAEQKAEAERLAKEAEERAEQDRIRAENAKLKAEADERERVIREERAKAEAERLKAESEKRAIEDAARKERERAAKLLLDARRALEDSEKALIECPNCHHRFIPKPQEVPVA